MELNQIQIHQNQSILDALKKLNEVRDVSRLILFVVDDGDKVIGSLTDGDIRRSLASNEDINKTVGSICNRNFEFIYNKDGYVELKKYKKKNILILPVLDEQFKMVKIVDLEKKKSILPVECMIMAGGRGKRLSPLTDSIPKPMLPLGGKPIIEHNIDRLISYGVKKIYISVKYLGEQIQDYFGDGSSKGIAIEYVWEDKPLGTAGALSLVDSFDSEYILLMNSDLFTDVDFEDLYLDLVNEKADMVIASTEYKVDVPFAVFETEKRQIKSFKEKPSYVYHSNAGVYMFKTELIRKIPKNQFYDITDLMEKNVLEAKKLIYNPILGYWIDIGSPSDYKRAQEFIKHIN
ncbi:nucleotidyltransferase family protein [Psychroflexus salis]|uniref:Mannose-1-phosphate guanylyltransferase n=1 Tax=Psychroflexus salis TaxID=1526574 RepID=A0A916ZTF7_9FLAO|nr:nucleotidyltransferase family protein [Psychroflexus salis]GGE10758.1 mannose-1-phosphate guanylyltransferase [Psychroflexus salis]